MMLTPPSRIFDRDREWADLSAFAGRPSAGPRIGIVYGRRRQGKSFLLRALTDANGGLYHQALEEDGAAALTTLGATIAADAGLSVPAVLRTWDAAIRELVVRAGEERVIVLDEFPFMLQKAPELESVVQRAYDEARDGRIPAFRLLLCGSAISIMGRLLSGARPLRGRAVLDLVVAPFDFRTAARFWGIDDPETAFLVHAVVGGTPGYRDLLEGEVPAAPGELLDWLAAGVLNPSHALFTEDIYLLTEDPAITDRALYQSVLAEIAAGRHTTREVGAALARTDQAMQHPLSVLERAGFVRREADVLLAKRPILRIADPMLRFHHAVIRSDRHRFAERRAAEAWSYARSRFESGVLGPHFEDLCREWVRRFASPSTLGGRAGRVGSTAVNDREARRRFEIDVAVTDAEAAGERPTLLAIGEAKGGAAAVGEGELDRLERLRTVLAERADTGRTRLLLFGRAGFDRGLRRRVAGRADVVLVDLGRLYSGD